MNAAVIVSAVRTAIGSFGGSLKDISAVDLGIAVSKAALNKATADLGGESEPKRLREVSQHLDVDEVIFGNVLSAGLGQNVARQIAVKAGLGDEVPGVSVNRVCGSGMEAVIQAARAVQLGDCEAVLAGGTENMDQAPYLLEKARYGYRMGDATLVDSMIRDGLWCAFVDQHMGVTAEMVAEKYGITREMQDEFAAWSQNKAEIAVKSGKFRDEIVPVQVPQRKGLSVIFEQDEHPRFGTTVEKLAALKPAFKPGGTVTAGNASGINDGAAALLIMSDGKAIVTNAEPLAIIRSYAVCGVEPQHMGMGPVPATRKALSRAGLSLDDIDLIEGNEAFAATSLAVEREMGFLREKFNVNGGAIALGHPIGASGARILVTLVHEMRKRGAKYGLATMCIGGGMGLSVILERA